MAHIGLVYKDPESTKSPLPVPCWFRGGYWDHGGGLRVGLV